MSQMSRRSVLKTGGAIGAMGLAAGGLATGLAASPARANPGWDWSPAGSVVGSGDGADPKTVFDPVCDEVVANLFERGEVNRANSLLINWRKNGQALPSGLPTELRDYLEEARRLPAWTDRGKLATAVRFNEKRGTFLGVLYGFASGMMSTVIPEEAWAVYYSKGGANMKGRISRTAKLGYDIGSRNAYLDDGEMIVTSVKTRLAHSGVRYLLPKSSHWNRSSPADTPISQNDMMVTWHSLPTTVMRTLRKWGVQIDPAESEAFLHSWQVSGHMLGIQDQYLPATWADADHQATKVLDPILAPTPEGIKLADMLLDLGHGLDLTLLSRGVLGALTRHTLGDRIADWLYIPREPVWDPLLDVAWGPYIAVREGLLDIGGEVTPQAYWLFDEFLRQFVLLYMSELRPINIQIPTFNNPNYN